MLNLQVILAFVGEPHGKMANEHMGSRSNANICFVRVKEETITGVRRKLRRKKLLILSAFLW